MGESVLHLRMKESVSRELAEEGYAVFFEPPYAPSKFLTWVSYRPDLFGIRASAGRQEYALVECETRPSSRRLESKNFRSVDVQTRLNSDLSLRRILVVPRGTLAGVDPSVRRCWETWIYEGGSFQRFPRACDAMTPASGQSAAPSPAQDANPFYLNAAPLARCLRRRT
jgi:hypothetical protein